MARPGGGLDPGTRTFSTTGSLHEARLDHAAALLPDGRVLVMGGMGERGVLASAEIWDPGTGSFSPTGSLTTARMVDAATPLSDGRVLVVGGVGDGDLTLASAEVWVSCHRVLHPHRIARHRAFRTNGHSPPGRPGHHRGRAGRGWRTLRHGGGLGPGYRHVRPHRTAGDGPRASCHHPPDRRPRPRRGRLWPEQRPGGGLPARPHLGGGLGPGHRHLRSDWVDGGGPHRPRCDAPA